jgi:site-specific recombinase XerD
MANIKVFLDTRFSKRQNGYQIKIRVQHTRTKKEEFATGEYLEDPSHFDKKLGRVRLLKKIDHQRINKLLIEKVAEYQDRTSPVQADGKVKTIRQKDDLIAEYKHKLKLTKAENSKSTADLYEVSFKHLTSFLKSEYNKEKLSTCEIDQILLDEYKIYLMNRKQADSTIKTYFNHFKTVYNCVAKRIKLNQYSPFKDYTVKVLKKKTVIPVNSFTKISRYIPKTPKRIEMKNIGMLQYYTQGTRASDIFTIRWNNIKFDNIRDEEYEELKNSKKESEMLTYYLNKSNRSYGDVKFSLKFKSIKTNKDHSIPLSNKAIIQLRFFLDKDLQIQYLSGDVFDKELRRYMKTPNPYKTYIYTDEELANKLKPLIIEQKERTAKSCITHKENINDFNKNKLLDWLKVKRDKTNKLFKKIQQEENYPLKFLIKTHSWRHMFSINYYTTKRDIYSLSKLLYHYSVGTTEEYLSKLDIKLICDNDIISFYDDL